MEAVEGASLENPLGLPRDNQGAVYQLQLAAVKGTEPRARCLRAIEVFNFLPSISNRIMIFNNLSLMQQIAAILIIEMDRKTCPRLSGFIKAPVAFRAAALANLTHHA